MNSAVEHELIDINPVSIRGAGVARRKHGIEPATLEDLDVIVEEMPQRLRLMVQVATWCALRYGELAERSRRPGPGRTDAPRVAAILDFREDGLHVLAEPEAGELDGCWLSVLALRDVLHVQHEFTKLSGAGGGDLPVARADDDPRRLERVDATHE